VSSFEKMLELLDAFTPETPTRSIDELIRFAGASRATTYRYVRALQSAGLLGALANGTYVLGPRIPELDRQVRVCDPMYNAAGPIMRRLVQQTGHGVLLCALFSDTVMCVRDERSESSPAELFNRGQKRPLFVAAASKIMLPYLSAHQLSQLYANNTAAIAAAGLGDTWDAFRASLREMRARGYCMTVSEFNPGIAGISAPVLNRSNNVLGSLGFAMAGEYVTEATLPRLVTLIVDAAAELAAVLRADETGMDRPARAVGRMRA
jgi:DNA-binding IclR family transcriptional regulator